MAFAPVSQNSARAGSVAVRETVADLKKIAEKSNPVLKVRSEPRFSSNSVQARLVKFRFHLEE